MSLPDSLRFPGRVLFVTEDPELLRAQLAGTDLAYAPGLPLRHNISTDEITPGWVCFYYDETLGRYCMVGLQGGVVTKDAIREGGFSVIVSGRSKGCGSSRETAPFSEWAAGIRLVIAESIEKIYRQNCQNIGLLTSTDFGLLSRIAKGEAIGIEEFTRGLDPISADVVRAGGLFAYNRGRLAGELAPPPISTSPRPMTMVEKILAAHAIADAARGTVGVPAVAPGDALFARTDIRFSHEYVTPMAEALFRQGAGDGAALRNPSTIYTFRDHLTFIGQVMPEEKKRLGLLERAEGLAETQARFAERHGLVLYGESEAGGSRAICHNAVVDELALPGQVVIGTDSHTCMAGVLGAFAFGVGSTDIANAWLTEDVRVTVPETVRFVLAGRLRAGVAAKDVMLHILAQPFFRTSQGIGKVLEFGGEGTMSLPIDERAVLTNMAVEAGGFTGIVEADEAVVAHLAALRVVDPGEVRRRIVTSDPGATYAATFAIDLDAIPPMVATPGDPRNGVPLHALEREVAVDIAYGGSCTGGKRSDMDMYARVFEAALAAGRRVHPDVRCFIQYGSDAIRRYAEERGYARIFDAVGATTLAPSCGACINAGPGASERPGQVTVSAQNRNFPGRSGPGDVYLASPLTVAASAVEGTLASPARVLGH